MSGLSGRPLPRRGCTLSSCPSPGEVPPAWQAPAAQSRTPHPDTGRHGRLPGLGAQGREGLWAGPRDAPTEAMRHVARSPGGPTAVGAPGTGRQRWVEGVDRLWALLGLH